MSRNQARSLWLAQNLFDEVQFSTHVVSASTSPTGGEAYRVGTARRSAIDAWTPGAENSTHWVQVDCGTPQPANLCVIDRGHNLDSTSHVGGFYLEGRNSTSAAWTELWRSTDVPSSPYPGPSTCVCGVRTFEGALLREFPVTVWRYYRLRIPPSTGYAPVIRNLALGLAFSPSNPALPPSDWDAAQVTYPETVTPSGWRGSGRVAVIREGSAFYRLESFGEYMAARTHLQEYESGVVSWYVPRRGRAEEALCVKIPPVTLPKPVEPGYPYRSLSLPYREHEPLPL